MRIPDLLRTSRLLLDANLDLRDVTRLEGQVSSGLRVTKPSDDPLHFGSILSLQHAIALQEQAKRNVEDGLTWLKATEAALNEIHETTSKSHTLLLEAANGSSSQASRKALAEELDQSLESLVVSGNSKLGELYLLGGTRVDAPPLAGTRDAQGRLQEIKFDGNTDRIRRLVDPTSTPLSINLTADQVALQRTHSIIGNTSLSDPGDLLANQVPGAVSGTFSVNGVTFDVDVTTDSLQELVQRINQAGVGAKAVVEEGRLKLVSTSARGEVQVASGSSNLLEELEVIDASGAIVGEQQGASNLFSTLMEARNFLLEWDGTGKAPLTLPVARLMTQQSRTILQAEGKVSEEFSGEHRLRVQAVNFGTASVSSDSTSTLVDGASNTGLQAAGRLQFEVDATGNIVAGSVSFTPATLGGRPLTASEQAVLDAANAGGVSLASDTFAGLGLTLSLDASSSSVQGTVAIDVAPTEVTFEDKFYSSPNAAPRVEQFTAYANEYNTLQSGPLAGATLQLGDAVQSETSVVETKSWAEQLDFEAQEVSSYITGLGGQERMFQSRADFMDNGLTNLKTELSDTQDVDITEAIVQLKQAQNAYQAALMVASRAFGKSLFDYI